MNLLVYSCTSSYWYENFRIKIRAVLQYLLVGKQGSAPKKSGTGTRVLPLPGHSSLGIARTVFASFVLYKPHSRIYARARSPPNLRHVDSYPYAHGVCKTVHLPDCAHCGSPLPTLVTGGSCLQ
eukprot:COSAG02_NODE_8_length_60691_cov_104.994752_15_plen_124_part_00